MISSKESHHKFFYSFISSRNKISSENPILTKTYKFYSLQILLISLIHILSMNLFASELLSFQALWWIRNGSGLINLLVQLLWNFYFLLKSILKLRPIGWCFNSSKRIVNIISFPICHILFLLRILFLSPEHAWQKVHHKIINSSLVRGFCREPLSSNINCIILSFSHMKCAQPNIDSTYSKIYPFSFWVSIVKVDFFDFYRSMDLLLQISRIFR